MNEMNNAVFGKAMENVRNHSKVFLQNEMVGLYGVKHSMVVIIAKE